MKPIQQAAAGAVFLTEMGHRFFVYNISNDKARKHNKYQKALKAKE